MSFRPCGEIFNKKNKIMIGLGTATLGRPQYIKIN